MKWKKMGRLFCPDNKFPWMVSHAANPTAEYRREDVWRVYFSPRDLQNRSSIGFVDFDLRYPFTILAVSEIPVLSFGDRGAFDDSGASIGCLVSAGGRTHLYYLGWNLGVTVPFRNSIGLATRESSNGLFRKISSAPIMDRNDVDPLSLSYPWIIREELAWKMWYGSTLRWGEGFNDMEHVIKYAESTDGIHWHRKGLVGINVASPHEMAISRPFVLLEDSRYKMWYSYRNGTYRIGYAESEDGIHWHRLDAKAGIDVSESGWDSEMIEYPFVFDHKGQRYMLYNGNGFGRTGFGIAVLDQGD